MTIKIVVIGDTHAFKFEELPEEMRFAIKKAGWVIHVGDYTSIEVVKSIIKLKGDKFKGVYGNADPLDIRKELKHREILKIRDIKIGIIHPAIGGYAEYIEKRALAEFRNDDVNVIMYGHTHEPKISQKNGILLISPGRGYLEEHYFGSPTSLAVLTINEEINGELKIINK